MINILPYEVNVLTSIWCLVCSEDHESNPMYAGYHAYASLLVYYLKSTFGLELKNVG